MCLLKVCVGCAGLGRSPALAVRLSVSACVGCATVQVCHSPLLAGDGTGSSPPGPSLAGASPDSGPGAGASVTGPPGEIKGEPGTGIFGKVVVTAALPPRAKTPFPLFFPLIPNY